METIRRSESVIAGGILIGGVSSAFHIWLVRNFLSDEEFGSLLAWTAIVSVTGSLVSGPIMSLGIKARGRGGHKQVQKLGEIESLALLFLGIPILMKVLIDIGTLDSSRLVPSVYSLSVMLSGTLHLLCARQRAWLSANGYWLLVAMQISIDGVGRCLLLIALLATSVVGFSYAIWTILIAQVLAFTAIGIKTQFRDIGFAQPRLPTKNTLSGTVAIWANTFGLQIIYSAPAVSSYFFSDANTRVSNSIALIFYIARIPISFAPALNVPLLATRSDEHFEAQVHPLVPSSIFFRRTYAVFLLMAAQATCATIILTEIFNYELREVFLPTIVCSIATTIFMIAQRFSTLLVSAGKYVSVFAVWSLTAASVVALLRITGSKPNQISVSVLAGSILALSSLFFLKQQDHVTNAH